MAKKQKKNASEVEVSFRALVNYVQPSHHGLYEAFDYVDPGYAALSFKPIEICKDVPTDAREIEFKLVHLRKRASTKKALAELKRRRLRPALYEELLAFVAKYPDLQKEFRIVALGSVWCILGAARKFAHFRRYRYSPFVDFIKDRGRSLAFNWIRNGWADDYRFLAVRE